MFELKSTNTFLHIDEYIRNALSSLFITFRTCDKELYLVGGCVRDLLLNKEPKDYDLCTNATPEEIKEILNKDALISYRYSIIETGIKHGTLTIHDKICSLFFEITTYRIDGKYEDSRHPSEVTFTPSLEEDLKRRDFTINSFAYDLLNNTLVMLDESYLDDLKFGIIRIVGNSNERFKEDALRMLRAIRFSAQLNFAISKDTYEAIKKNANLIQHISKERVRDELTKILLSDNPQMLEFVYETGLESFLYGDIYVPIGAMLNCTQHNKYHYTDVFHHTMDVIKNLPKEFIIRWSAFFHDIGKPEDKTIDEAGYEHFYDHVSKSVEIAKKMMDTLKFSNEQKDTILNFVKYHDYKLDTCKNSVFKRVLNKITDEYFLDFIKFKRADALAHRLVMSTDFSIDAIDKIYQRYKKIKDEMQALSLKDLKVDGYDMMDLGLSGKQVGDVLNFLLEKVLEDSTLNNRETLLELTRGKMNE